MTDKKKDFEDALDDLFDWNAPQPIETVKRERLDQIKEAAKRSKRRARPQGKSRAKPTGKRKRKAKMILSDEDKEKVAKGVFRGDFQPIKQEVTEKRGHMESRIVAYYYARCHADYHGTRVVNWQKRFETNKSAVGCFSKAAISAELAGVSVEDFVKAQFWWFDSRMGITPTYQSLAGPRARERVLEWEKEKTFKGVPKNVVSKVMQKVDTTKIPIEKRMAYELDVLARMARRWGGEKEVWAMFGAPGDEEVFPEDFKRTRRVWRDMYMKWFDLEFQYCVADALTGKVLHGPMSSRITTQCLVPSDWASRRVASLTPPQNVYYPKGTKPVMVLSDIAVHAEGVLPADHRWVKVDTPLPGKTRFRLWERVKCRVCGVEGRRDLKDGRVHRNREYADPFYANCGEVYKKNNGGDDVA